MTKTASTSSTSAPPRAGASTTHRWLLILVLVAGFNFVLGLLVGRGTSPLKFDISALERELARLREVELQAEIKRFRIAMDDGEGRSPLGFYHELKQDDGVRVPVPGPRIAARSTAAAPVPQAPKPPSPTPKAPPAAGGAMLQVAALREAASAEQIAHKLREQGFAVRIVKARVDGQGTWYRVRIGPFATRQATQEVRERLVRLNFNAMIVDE